jgi:hypothetical protein
VTDSASWYAGNDHYLSLSMTWLRLRLERAAAGYAAAVGTTHTSDTSRIVPLSSDLEVAPARSVQPAHKPPQRRLFHRRTETTVVDSGHPVEVVTVTRATVPPPDAATTRDWDAEIAAAATAVDDAATALAPPPALERIADAFGLSDFERQVLLLCAAPELDTSVEQLLIDSHGQPWPTFAIAMDVLDDPSWQARSPESPLRYWHLVEAGDGEQRSLSATALHIDERMLNLIKGLDHLDARLASVMVAEPLSAHDLPPSQEAVVEQAHALVSASAGDTSTPVIQLIGPHAQARTSVATHIAAGFGLNLFALQARLLPPTVGEIDLLARLWHREALIAPVALYVDDDDADGAAANARSTFLARTGGLVLVGSGDVAADLAGTSIVLDVARPTAVEQVELWQDALRPESSVDIGQLVEQFDLDAETIRLLAARVGPSDDDADQTARLRASARQHLRPQLETAAQRVRPLATWESLVLPDAELSLLHQISSQVGNRFRVHTDWGFERRMNRGLGVSALFAGESGTGKSMAAEVLANDLGLDLYRIDLSAVVSKYIGETEKNLRKLFDAAEGGGVILFFDEADALFGKRSEVKDAHDRYANIETNYLLQRMEQYGGLAILATNMRSSLDRAFSRRLRFIVTFPFPTPVCRARMWELAFPPEVPLDELDIAQLTRIDLNGAGIAAAALNAAFAAAAAGHDVGMDDVLAAARAELRKLDRPVNEAHFRPSVQVRR